jgi:hypothetical protein
MGREQEGDVDEQASHFAIYAGGQPARGEPPGRSVQELWFALTRARWSSVVLVPADEGGSVHRIATELADVGTRLHHSPVTAIVADTVDYAAARALADMQASQEDRPWRGDIDVDVSAVNPADRQATIASSAPSYEAKLMPPIGRIIIAIPSVMEYPLGVAIAQRADAVVLCVDVGVTRMKSARRTMDLIGRERIVGSILVR